MNLGARDLAVLAWVSTFGVLWLVLLGYVSLNGVSIGGFVFSLLVALSASAMTRPPVRMGRDG